MLVWLQGKAWITERTGPPPHEARFRGLSLRAVPLAPFFGPRQGGVRCGPSPQPGPGPSLAIAESEGPWLTAGQNTEGATRELGPS